MKAERLDISPGRERGDSEFARKLDQADMNDTEGRIAHVESLQRPDEWKAATTSDGRTYYYNRKTRVSAWKVPFGGKLAAPSTSSLSSSSSSSRVPGDERQTKNTVVTQSSGLFCMFCGAAPARLGLPCLLTRRMPTVRPGERGSSRRRHEIGGEVRYSWSNKHK